MPTFKVLARERHGKEVNLNIVAKDKDEVVWQLRDRNLFPLKIQRQLEFDFNFGNIRKKHDLKWLSNFSKELYYPHKAGMNLHQSLKMVRDKSKKNKKIIEDLIRIMESGVDLSVAMEKYPQVFPAHVIYQLRSAEAGGFTEEALLNISKDLEREYTFKRDIIASMSQPIITIIVAFIILTVMVVKIIPMLTIELVDSESPIPTSTAKLMKLSAFLNNNYQYIILSIITLAIIGIIVYKNQNTRNLIDYTLLKLPFFGKIYYLIQISMFCRIASSLLKGGIGVQYTLDYISNVLSNKYISRGVMLAKRTITDEGQPLSIGLKKAGVFDEELIQYIALGEENGQLEEILNELYKQFEERIGVSLKAVKNLATPLLIMIVIVIVGILVVNLVLPMFSMLDQF